MLIRYEETQDSIGIPYPAEQRADGVNHGYFDLKRSPELLGSVPELQNVKELTAFVEELNHPESLFRSLGCEKAFSSIKDPLASKKVTSFVRLSFELLDWNTLDNYRRLYRYYEESVALATAALTDLVRVEFEVTPATFKAHDRTLWSLSIWNTGLGRNTPEARANWTAGLSTVEECFRHQRHAFQNKFQADMAAGLATIS